ncbi:NucA/NucB deoxyribonuclease domain-containing protein [Streptococcus caprae]|uniref:Deoxyribonuclease NucA/NucB domain-containing protein n=1 Tax=Streptococcus caprae TaxID=1640501 RepID=A0ABV8CUE8_9STRE
MYNNDTQVANYVKKIDWRKVAVTAGAIGVGIVLTVATGGLGAPVAMAIGGAASGAIMSGYDAYSSGQRGWALVGSIAKGAGLGAITGFVGGQFIGAGANVAANVTQNIANQTVRHVAKAGVEAGVETAIDTGISLATGNPITLKNVATDYGLNLITNGSGSVSSKKSAKADVPKNKPKSGDVAVTKSRQSSTPVQQLSNPGPNKSRIPVEAVDGNGNKVYGEILEPGYIHTRPVKNVTSTSSNTSTSQKLISGPDPNAPRLEAPKQHLALPMPNDIVTIQVSKSKYPESAQHIQDARANGPSSILTIDRPGAKTNRSQSLKGIDKVPDMDLDEYPPAMFAEGGEGASVRAINRSDNRGSGSSMGHQLRPFDNGTKVFIDIVD